MAKRSPDLPTMQHDAVLWQLISDLRFEGGHIVIPQGLALPERATIRVGLEAMRAVYGASVEVDLRDAED